MVRDYAKTPTREKLDMLMEKFDGLIKSIATRIAPRFMGVMEYDDILQYAKIGLVRALSKYNPKKGYFVKYAKIIINGTVFDNLRKEGHIVRSCTKSEMKRSLTPYRMIPLCDISEEEENLGGYDSDYEKAEEELDADAFMKQKMVIINEVIGTMTERDQKVIRMIIATRLPKNQISPLFNVSTSRVSQIFRLFVDRCRIASGKTIHYDLSKISKAFTVRRHEEGLNLREYDKRCEN